MYPPFFEVCSSDQLIQALLGVNPTRIYPFGHAPQAGTSFYKVPYVVWTIVTGLPENYINEKPDIDSYTIQVDVYGNTSDSVRNVAMAVRDVSEFYSYVTSWRGESFDNSTGMYRISFDLGWFVNR